MEESLKCEYEKIAKFMGLIYFPFDSKLSIQNKSYPGWVRVGDKHDHITNSLGVICYKSSNHICRTTKQLGYKTSIEKIMKVVYRIESLESRKFGGFRVRIESDECRILPKNLAKQDSTIIYENGDGSKMMAIYKCCLSFIDWYNENKI